jgi:antitoxin component of RelBE/YafQ-DinJ toxin-antitoxin module
MGAKFRLFTFIGSPSKPGPCLASTLSGFSPYFFVACGIKMTTIGSNHEETPMQFTVRLPDDYKGKVATAAKRMGLKKSDIARLALKQFLDEHLAKDSRTPFEKVKHLLGSTESGIKDLGQEHRRYLVARIKKAS